MTKARDLANAADVLDDVSATELSYVNGVTSAIQTQLNAKQAVVSGVDDTEIGYLNGVTSAIQTQIDSKIGSASAISPTLIDAKGDLIVGSAADTAARLAVGTNNYVLTADSAATNGVKWAAASSGAMTLIKRASFSNVANTGTTFDDIFTSSYTSYLLVIDSIYSAAQNDDLHMQLRYAGPTTQASMYFVSNSYVARNSASTGYANSDDTAQALLAENSGNSTYLMNGQMYFYNVGNSSQNPLFMGQLVNFIENRNYQFGGGNDQARTYTGVLFKTSSANITGTISVYGLAKA